MNNIDLTMYYNEFIFGFLIAIAVLLILNIVLLFKVAKLNKRFSTFITNQNPEFNLEDVLANVIKNVGDFRKELDENVTICADANNLTNDKFDKLINDLDIKHTRNNEVSKEMIEVINNNLKICIQKTAVIRYNPFTNVGGELCFALSMLDKKNDGFIINTIFTENGSYTYCKPVENGVSSVKLSKEEQDSLNLAKNKVIM